MRVGVVGPQFADSFADNVVASLRAMGHSVTALGPAFPRSELRTGALALEMARRLPVGNRLLQQPLLRRARRQALDVVITVESLPPEAVRDLRGMGAKVALWFPDAISNLAAHLMFLAPYDAIFFKEPHLVERSQALLDAPVEYLPEACNPAWHRIPHPEVASDPCVLVVGNMYAFRVRLLERLARAGLPLKIFGPPWARWLRSPALEPMYTGRYVSRKEKARVFRSASVVLNSLHPAEVNGLNCRLFEAAACGGTLLTEYRPALGCCFEIGREVLAYDGFDDLVDKARWLLENRDAGKSLGNAAAARAHRDHTYAHRLQVILDSVCSEDHREPVKR